MTASKTLVHKIKALAFNLLPQAIRHRLIRSQIKYPDTSPEGIRFKIAETADELAQAFRLIHDNYVTHGYMDPHPSKMRLTKYHMLPTTSTLIALEGQNVVATASLILSSPFGMPCEMAYDLTALKIQRARIAEISGLAIHPKYAQNKGHLLWPLLKFMYEYSVNCFGVDSLVMVVTPQWFDFYAAVWFFEPFRNKTIRYDYVNGTPACGGYMALRQLKTISESVYSKLKSENNFHRYYFETTFDCFEFPQRHPSIAADPVMTPDLLRYFFKEQSNVIAELSDAEIQILRRLYDTDLFDRSNIEFATRMYWSHRQQQQQEIQAGVFLEAT